MTLERVLERILKLVEDDFPYPERIADAYNQHAITRSKRATMIVRELRAEVGRDPSLLEGLARRAGVTPNADE